MNRRSYLRALGLAGTVGLAGCFDWVGDGGTPSESPPGPPTGTPTGTPTGGSPGPSTSSPTETPPPADRFETVVDMVEDRGVDPTGNEPIDDALRSAAGDDTLLQFPPGTYLATEMLVLESVRNFGIEGTGASRTAVRFVHPKGFSDRLLNVRSGRNCLVRNVTVDQTDDDVTNSGVVVLNDDGVLVEDFEVAGFTPSRDQGSVDLIVQVTSREGEGTVRRFTSTGGGKVGVYPASYPGFFSGPQHVGTLKLVDFHLERCGSNGLYAGRTKGGVQVLGGLFKNNDVAQVRLSGKGSFVRGARIVVDTDDVDDVRGNYEGIRGIWWESGDQGKTGGYVERCEFVCRSSNGLRALLQIDGSAGGMAVRNSRFRVDEADYFAIFTRPPGRSNMGGTPSKPWGISVENTRIEGSSPKNAAVKIHGRPGSAVVDTTVVQHGTGQDGIRLVNSRGTRILRSDVAADRYPVLVDVGSGNANGGTAGTSCLLRLEDVVELRSFTLDPASGGLVELPDTAMTAPGTYCVTRESVPFDGERMGLVGLDGDDRVYLFDADQVTS